MGIMPPRSKLTWSTEVIYDKGRVLLGILLVCISVSIAGCAPLSGGSNESATLTEPDTNPGVTAQNETATFPEPDNHPGLAAQLDVKIFSSEPVRIEIIELGIQGRGVVYNKTISTTGEVLFGEDRLFRENGAYRVRITVNDISKWDRVIKHFEIYTLRVERNGTVNVTEHVIS